MDLRRTPFFRFHKEAGAKLIDFGGWEMPVQYTGLIAEHRACRASAGLFDVSHMGEVWFRGPGALDAVRRLVTNDVDLVDGQAQYTAMCYPDGGIVDDLIVYKLSDEEILICVNASNREKDYSWMAEHTRGVSVEDESDAWAQVAVQGRNAAAILQKLTPLDLGPLPSFHVARGSVAGVDGCILARTGYTGEDGFEVFLPATGAERMWPAIMEAGQEFGLGPVGLGARDTLRLEMKFCLYGNDIDATTTPLEAGLGWVTKLDKPDFIGKDALVRQQAEGVRRRLVAMVVNDRIARHGNPIVDGEGGPEIGVVTSGTRSPSLETNIALGYVPVSKSKIGSQVVVDIRGRTATAAVVKPPFYKRPY
jgi:aminomethyltransferase